MSADGPRAALSEKETSMERMFAAIRRYCQDWATMDPAVALGLFGTGVGLSVGEFPAGERIRRVTRSA